MNPERRAQLSRQLAETLNQLWEEDGRSILAVEYTRGGPQRIIVGEGSASVWITLEWATRFQPERGLSARRFYVHAEPISDCLEPYDHNGHVWQSKDGARRCPGAVAPPGGWTSLNEKRR